MCSKTILRCTFLGFRVEQAAENRPNIVQGCLRILAFSVDVVLQAGDSGSDGLLN